MSSCEVTKKMPMGGFCLPDENIDTNICWKLIDTTYDTIYNSGRRYNKCLNGIS